MESPIDDSYSTQSEFYSSQDSVNPEEPEEGVYYDSEEEEEEEHDEDIECFMSKEEYPPRLVHKKQSGWLHEFLSNNEEDSQLLRHRKINENSSSSSLLMSNEPDKKRQNFLDASLRYEREDRNERRFCYTIVGILVCVTIILVAMRSILLKRAPSDTVDPALFPKHHLDEDQKIGTSSLPVSVQSHPRSGSSQFVYDTYSSWDAYEKDRITCQSPSDAEMLIWTNMSEACSEGLCLGINPFLQILEDHARQDGDAYSTMGRLSGSSTDKTGLIPCAYATRDETNESLTRSYLDPILKNPQGLLYEAEFVLDLLGDYHKKMRVPRKATLVYREWPTGELNTTSVEGIEAARWTMVMFILGKSI